MRIAIRFSRTLAAVLVIGHGLAMGAVALATSPVSWLMPMIITAIFASLVFNLRSINPNRPDAVIMIALSEDGTLNIQNGHGRWFECRVLGGTYVSRYLTVLDLRLLDNEMIRKHIVILPDAINPEDFRALRTWLRWKAKRTGQESIEMP